MEIQASCTFDEKTMTALHRYTISKRGNPKKRLTVISILYAALIALILLEIWWFGPDTQMIVLLIICVLFLVWYLYRYFWAGKMRHRRMENMQGMVNRYVFYPDEMEITSDGAGYNGSSRVKYHFFQKVKETQDYFFIYQTNRQVVIVDKSTITGGTAEQIRSWLSAWIEGKKYIICKY